MSETEFKLNDGQQVAVDHIGGPLLVVAGAGTGKTRVIVEKINTLLDSGADPAGILAVTFTEKAAAEMLDRVIGSRSGVVPELPILTFNGFGDSLLREFGVHIGLPRTFRLLSEQAQVVFFRERIDIFSLDYFLPLTSSPDGVIAEILQLFGRLKQNVITPAAYQQFAAALPEIDDAAALEKQRHLELANAYATYTELCRSENVIDYDDQIYLCIQLLKQRPNIQLQLQKRYHTLLIDEFQDTNAMQSALIDLLYNGKPQTLIVVGDDDQSIYGWRGATLQNILGFTVRYPDTKQTALTENYRSGQAILDAAHRLIQNNNPNRLEASLGIDKRLIAHKTGNDPVLMRFADTAAELDWISNDIQNRIAEQGVGKPISIAVLARSNNTALAVHAVLAANDVPHRVIGATQDLYTRPVVRMLTELTRTLVEPHNNVSLHHTLVSELFAIPNAVIATPSALASHQHELLENILLEEELPEIHTALNRIKSWREKAASSSVGRLLWQAISETGYKNRLLQQAPHDDVAAASVQHLAQYFESLRQFESIALQPTATQYLASLPALQAAGETTDDGTLAISDDEVTVITVHKAKGLEWDTVYIPVLQEQAFPLKKRAEGLQPPDELKVTNTNPADEHYAEERRLMYVAATRARRNLILTYSDAGKSGTARKPSRFIDELFGGNAAETTALADSTSEPALLLETTAERASKITVPSDIFDGTFVRLSVSQASALLDCPLNFYYKFILKAPEQATPSTNYGSGLHHILEDINKARQDNSLKPLEHYLDELSRSWSKVGYASLQQQQNAFAQAQQTVTTFYQNAKSQPAPLLVEAPFEITLEPENVVLRGRMDVVYDNGGIEIRDYKTGNTIKDESAAKKRATSSSQLTMYALAWQQMHGTLPATVSLAFVDTNYVGSVSKTERGIEGLRGKLAKAAEHIRNHDFPPGFRHNHCIHPPISEL